MPVERSSRSGVYSGASLSPLSYVIRSKVELGAIGNLVRLVNRNNRSRC